MKNRSYTAAFLLGPLLFLTALQSASAQTIINIDFLEQRGSEAATTNYTGVGAAGGSNFNPLTADDSSSTDNITVAGTGLKDTAGSTTLVNFTVGPIGADNALGNGLPVLNDGYLFLNSSNNHLTSTPFSFTGLGSATSATLYFYTASSAVYGGYYQGETFTVPGGTLATFTPTGIFTAANTVEYTDVPIVAGSIAGTFDTAGTPLGTGIYSGVTIVFNTPEGVVPEPSSWAMVLIGCSALIGTTYLRRKSA